MKKLGLLGKTLSHSFSKSYFENKFRNESIEDFQYINFELEKIEDLEQLIGKERPIGFNVTIPYKESIIPFLDELDEIAKEVGAVNTVTVNYDNPSKPYLKGYNTDVFGFGQSIKPFLEGTHEKALILGTGGASKAVAYVLNNLGIDIVYVSRSERSFNIINYTDLNDKVMEFCPLIVNTTPVGTFPNVNDHLPIPFENIGERHLVVDLIYNPPETELLKRAKANGAKTLNGLSMLQQQAERAWEIFQNNI
jgi:shikimate dehydrogenase